MSFTNKKILKTLLTACVLGVAAPVALADGDWGGGMKKDHHMMKGHHAKMGKSWDGAKGGEWSMSEGHMTARLRAVWNLDLTPEQRARIRKIQRDLRKKHWALEDKIEDVSDKLFELYRAPERDAKAIGKIYGQIFDYRRQMIELAIEAGNEVGKVLTPEQRRQWMMMLPHPKWGAGWGQ